MAAMQDVEAAVGEHQRPRHAGEALGQRVGRADLGFEGRGRVGHYFAAAAGWPPGVGLPDGLSRRLISASETISKTRTTFFTPPVVRATSTAASASRGDDAEQVNDAVFGHHLDVVGRELVGVDEARLDLGGDEAVVAARATAN